MTVPDDAAIELEFYERFFIDRGLEPYPVQDEACSKILRGENVLVTVPTGTGKTLMAKAGILRALRLGRRAIYTTPLRALTEEKFRELSEDFGAEAVGFATGDYQVNPGAPIQVLVAEILWNKIYGNRQKLPADIVIMDEGHYFNDPERGYVWEQSIIGLDPRSQLIILSATVGYAEQFCQWVYLTRRLPMALVRSSERKVPLYHEFRESYLIEAVRELATAGDCPAIVFSFSRKECFERARLLKSCARFVTDEEREKIQEMAAPVLLDFGFGPDLAPLLYHGIGIHHAGILPRYRQLVESLTLQRLCKFVLSTETISAGINLPAKRVLFPSLRKYVKNKSRLLTAAEYHQMSGRAGRPQFDQEGIALTLAPEEVVQEFRKEIKDAKKSGYAVDEEKIKKKHFARAKAEARAKNDVSWDAETHAKLVGGQPAALASKTKITAEQILAIGLPDLAEDALPGQQFLIAQPGALEAGAETPSAVPSQDAAPKSAELPPAVNETELPPHLNLNIRTVIDHLLLSEEERRESHKRLAQITNNLRALGVLDEHGRQIKGEMINRIRGIDGLFVYYCLLNRDLDYEKCRELSEFLIDHDVIQRQLSRKDEDKKKEWVRARLRELRQEGRDVSFEEVEEMYNREFPRELSFIETAHQEFCAQVPHPELHGGKIQNTVFAQLDEAGSSFADFVQAHELETEEGSLFSYLARVMKVGKMLFEVSAIASFSEVEQRVRHILGQVDARVLGES